jgi:GNAT superfamily N-acetyltransferase
MQVEIREESVAWLDEHARISIAFKVESVLALTIVNHGLGGLRLDERQLNAPYVKDYDRLPNCHPSEWSTQLDMANWGFFSARSEGAPVGGAVVAWTSPSLEMLEGRTDLGVIWDVRVSPAMRRRGIAAQLFAVAERWARARGCRRLKVETQNINVAACRFYASRGFELGAIHRFAYPTLPDETQLLWYKGLC